MVGGARGEGSLPHPRAAEAPRSGAEGQGALTGKGGPAANTGEPSCRKMPPQIATLPWVVDHEFKLTPAGVFYGFHPCGLCLLECGRCVGT